MCRYAVIILRVTVKEINESVYSIHIENTKTTSLEDVSSGVLENIKNI